MKLYVYYKNLDVNCQTGLIGSVSFGDNSNIIVEETTSLKRFIKLITGRKSNAINEEFFYNGAHCSNSNSKFNISCFSQQLRSNHSTDVHVYFIGNGFLVQQDNSAYLLDEEYFSHSFTTELINESLFPFWAGSIPNPDLESIVTLQIEPEPAPEPEPDPFVGIGTLKDTNF